MTTLLDMLDDRVRHDPGSPLITDYTQGRVELSAATVELWVAKTANLLSLEVGLEAGDVVSLDLPLHWMTAAAALGALRGGYDVVIDGSVPADAAFCLEGAPVDTGSAEIRVTLDPLGMAPAPAGSAGCTAFPADARSQPDRIVLPAPHTGGLIIAGHRHGPQAVARAATGAAADAGLRSGGRLLTDHAPDTLAGFLAMIGAPLAAGGAAVYGTLSPAQRDAESITAQA